MAKGRRSLQTLWCVWGALIAATPCTLRLGAIFEYAPNALIAPLQLSPVALSLALLTALLVLPTSNPKRGGVLARGLSKASPVLMSLSISLAALCEIGWLPMRLHDFTLVDFGPMLSILGSIAQLLSLSMWSLLGLSCVAEGDDDASSLDNRSCFVAIALGSFVVSGLGCALALAVNLFFQLALCFISGLVAWGTLRKLTSHRLSRRSFGAFSVAILGGLFSSALLREAISNLYFDSMMVLSEDKKHVCLLALLALLLACTTVTMLTDQYFTSRGHEDDTDFRSLLARLPHAEQLSERQREVLTLCASGLSRKEAASSIGISPGSAGTHLSRGLNRMGFGSFEGLKASLDTEKTIVEGRARKKDLLFVLLRAAVLIASMLIIPPYEILLTLLPFFASLLVLIGGTEAALKAADKSTPRIICNWDLTLCRISLIIDGILLGLLWDFHLPQASIAIVVCTTLSIILAGVSCETTKTARSAMPRMATDILFSGARLIFIRLPESALLIGSGMGLYYPIVNFGQNIPIILFATLAVQICLTLSSVKDLRRLLSTQEALDNIEAGADHAFLISRGLSENESRILLLAAQGYTRAEIQKKLIISEGTVNSYKASAYRKLGIHRIADLKELLGKHAG